MTDAREVRALLEDRPNLEPALESVLTTDRNHDPDTWTFDDTDLDSGHFGQLVSEGVVEKVDGEYRLADPDAVERALAGDVGSGDGIEFSFSLPSVDSDRRVAAALTGALLLVFVFRILPFNDIFRDGRVVLSGNDPYVYLYRVERMAEAATGALDFGVLSSPSSIPLGGEPLLVAVLWFVTEIAGGVEAAPHVAAWYPAVAGVLTAAFVYLFATGLTDDRRVGIASVLMIAVMPVLTFRSGLGFADHHAFDYIWLSLTVAAVVRLVHLSATRAALSSLRNVGWMIVSGVAIGAQMLAWDAGPLLLFPLVLYVPLAGLVALDEGKSPIWSFAPLAIATAIATAISGSAHLALSWQTPQVAYAPAFILVGTIGVATVAEAVHRAPSLPASPLRVLAGLEAVGVAVAVLLLTTVLPEYGTRLFRQLRRIATNESIVEANSLFSANTFGWLFLFGFLLFVAVPYMGWGVFRAVRGDDRRRWLLASVYAWFFMILAMFQMRFAGELSVFVAVFAGLGFVHIAERVDLARPPVPFTRSQPTRHEADESTPAFEIPDLRDAAALLFLFLLISGLSVAQGPAKAQQVTQSENAVETAIWIDEYAEEKGLEYPENYVFSEWGRNRMYNYFVSGESESYTYALDNYETFATSTEFDGWYERFDGRVGFVVFVRTSTSEPTLYNRLTKAGGSRFKGYNGSGHFRMVRATQVRQVHQVVPGANVTGRVTGSSGPRANATVFVRTGIEVDGYESRYIRRTTTDADGQYHVRVAYPGEYEVLRPDSNATTTVTVSEAAVENGEQVDAGALATSEPADTNNQTALRRPPYQVSPS